MPPLVPCLEALGVWVVVTAIGWPVFLSFAAYVAAQWKWRQMKKAGRE